MPLAYPAPLYLYPPRPSNLVDSGLLGFYEQNHWVAQIKKNGICTVLFVSPDKQISLKTRHNQELRWAPDSNFYKQFLHLDGWNVFCGEFLKDRVYLFDILVETNSYLYGVTLGKRLERLHNLFPGAKSITPSHYVVSPSLWVAETITNNFTRIFNGLHSEIDEGMVLKDHEARLELCTTERANAKSQVKCRR